MAFTLYAADLVVLHKGLSAFGKQKLPEKPLELTEAQRINAASAYRIQEEVLEQIHNFGKDDEDLLLRNLVKLKSYVSVTKSLLQRIPDIDLTELRAGRFGRYTEADGKLLVDLVASYDRAVTELEVQAELAKTKK